MNEKCRNCGSQIAPVQESGFLAADGNSFLCQYCKEDEMEGIKRCSDCRDGEHENYDDDVQFVEIRDPDGSGFVKRANLCGEHREMYHSDGYYVRTVS